MTLILSLFAFLGCGGSAINPNQQACTEMAAASVMLSVVDENGDPLVADITAEDEDGNAIIADCSPIDGEDCTEWVVGYEVDGKITIHASAFDGCNEGNGELVVDVPMDEDGCHVVGQTVTLIVDEWTDLACGE